MQCNENKPFCLRCKKGSKECIYPYSVANEVTFKDAAAAELDDSTFCDFGSSSDSCHVQDRDNSDDREMATFKFSSAKSSLYDDFPFPLEIERQTEAQTSISGFDEIDSPVNPQYRTYSVVADLDKLDAIDSFQTWPARSLRLFVAISRSISSRAEQLSRVQFFLKYH
jgi:hypothetical protein